MAEHRDLEAEANARIVIRPEDLPRRPAAPDVTRVGPISEAGRQPLPGRLRAGDRTAALASAAAFVTLVAILCWFVLATDEEAGPPGRRVQDRAAQFKAAIEEVLRQDRALVARVAARAGPVDKYWDASPLVGEYVEGLRAIETDRCPEEFQLAYLKHVQAWRGLHAALASNQGLNGFIKGFFLGPEAVRGGVTAVEGEEKRVRETWFDVEQIALRYRVRVQPARP